MKLQNLLLYVWYVPHMNIAFMLILWWTKTHAIFDKLNSHSEGNIM